MNAADWDAFDANLVRALDLDGDERAAYLDSLDAETRAAVEQMLEVALADHPVLDHPEGAVASLVEPGDGPGIEQGARVGPYQIEELVGEGGMGRVYRARRADGAYDKTVAVKVVRRSLTLAGSDVLLRLRRERALLATLDHPGIARLVDGGETDDGVPYLVTDFVDGTPITDWANARDLGVRARVRLLAEVARAVDHAHQRLVVHRDLKPSNVLVTGEADAPRPVVLDFGIAKLLEAAEDDDSGAFPLTQTGMRMLTPAYAAPELYEPTATLTTAVDVYGLGALLYELLTGRRPHDVAAGTPPTTEPTRPSRVVTEPTEPPLADPSTRSRALRGDLDTICLKALHPDPARRYASAADLAADLARYLDGRPVEARPDSLGYVASRFVRRNRAVVAAGALAVLALVVGLGVALVALGAQRAALAEATASADRASEAAQLLGDLFQSAEPDASSSGDMTVREALDRGQDRIAAVEPASLRGYLLSVLGAAYLEIGDFDRSDSLLTAAVDLLDGSDATPGVRALSLHNLAEHRTMSGDTRSALPLLLQADSLARREVRPDSSLLLDIATSLSWAYRDLQELPVATEWAERSVALSRSMPPGERAMALSELSRSYFYAGRLDEAIETTGRAITLHRESEGPDGASVGVLSSQMAHTLMAAGRLDDAMPHARRAVRIARRVYDADHVRRFESMGLLGQLLEVSGELREAAAYYDSTVAIARTLPAARTSTGMSMVTSLATVRADLGDYRGAEQAGLEALRFAETLPPESFRLDELVAMAQLQTGLAMHQQGKRSGRAMLSRALASIEALDPEARAPWMEDPDVQAAQAALRS